MHVVNAGNVEINNHKSCADIYDIDLKSLVMSITMSLYILYYF